LRYSNVCQNDKKLKDMFISVRTGGHLFSIHQLLTVLQVFDCIGEGFGDPDMVGVGLATRPRGNVLSIWVKDNSSETRSSIG